MTQPEGVAAGPVGAEVRPLDDRKVPWRVFLGVGVFIGLISLFYVPSFEAAGIVMLTVAAVLGLWIGTFLWLQNRHAVAAEVPVQVDPDEYLPHASVWPFTIGIGATLFFNGLVLGIWVVIPGVVLLALGIGGFTRQTRRRD